MNTTQLLAQLESTDQWAYHANGPTASEPAAWACMALSLYGKHDAAERIANWLVHIQQPSGAIGITEAERTPTWPTSLAILAWLSVVSQKSAHGKAQFHQSIQRAIRWSLDIHGKAAPQKSHIGHDTTIVGWSWAADTHSWLEPTCLYVIALKAAGQGEHPRVQEGLRLIIDRILPTGGSNYGNTQVLGQTLLPHVQPTGLSILALSDTTVEDKRIELSIQYLTNTMQQEQSTSSIVPTASLCFALLGLTAHRRRPAAANTWLQTAFERVNQQQPSIYKLSLLALAAREDGMFES